MSGGHVREASEPHEVVGSLRVAKLSEYIHSDRFLSFDELTVEQVDQRVALTSMEQVLTEFDQVGAGVLSGGHRLLTCRYPYLGWQDR